MIGRNFSIFARALEQKYPDKWFDCSNVIAIGTVDERALFYALSNNMNVFIFNNTNLTEISKQGIFTHAHSHINTLDRKDTVVHIPQKVNGHIGDSLAGIGFLAAVDGELPYSNLWRDIFDPELIKNNLDRVLLAEKVLTGDDSKAVYWGRLLYRLTHNPHYSYRTKGVEYFHPMCSPLPGDVIIDGGAFEGVTLKEFQEALSDKCVIHAFEPDTKNYAKLKKFSGKYTHTYNLGLYDKKTTLEFVEYENCASHILDAMHIDKTENIKANEKIKVVDLDTFAQERNIVPDFIKLDVEGSELAVLRGARKTIQTHKPRLAVSAYHRYDDLWEIPLLINEINPDYTIYLAHYGEDHFFDPTYFAV